MSTLAEGELVIDSSGLGDPGGSMDKVGGLLRYNLATASLPPVGQCFVLDVTVQNTLTGEQKSESVLLKRR